MRADGLGPVYNGQACGQCHQNPVSGGISQVTALRAGAVASGIFGEHPGGSLIQDRAIDPNFQERVLPGNSVRAFRTSLNTLGDGFVECIASETLEVPVVPELVAPLVTVLPLQLLAYYVADLKGTDVDQPRNLAKTVTVE